MKVKFVVLGLMMLALMLMPIQAAYTPTLVTGIYSKQFTVDMTTYPSKPCSDINNLNSGNCQYLYAVYAVIPQGALDFSSAVLRDAYDITSSKKQSFNVTFTPAKGHRWAVATFGVVDNQTYVIEYIQGANITRCIGGGNMTCPVDGYYHCSDASKEQVVGGRIQCNFITYSKGGNLTKCVGSFMQCNADGLFHCNNTAGETVVNGRISCAATGVTQTTSATTARNYYWNSTLSIPLDYRNADSLISLCEDGKILSKNICYNYQSACINQYATSMCTNPYRLFVLDKGTGYNYNDPSTYCADRNVDYVCDEVVSVVCPDTNNNGICDADDIYIQNSSCIDTNMNFVCDNVETEGVFCRNYVDYWFGYKADGTCVTVPNSCFLTGLGLTNTSAGQCAPKFTNLCTSNYDCIAPCQGITGICKAVVVNGTNMGNACSYAGECNPRQIQCNTEADCPASPCVGMVARCTTANTCVYDGTCITQPQNNQNLWTRLASLFASIITWISGAIGW